jgi:hypothetical protein
MKRLRHWLFNGLATASLILAVATARVWVQSYWFQDEFTWNPRSDDTDQRTILISRGGVQLSHDSYKSRLATPVIYGRHPYHHETTLAKSYPYSPGAPQGQVLRLNELRLAGLEYVSGETLFPAANVSFQSMTFPLPMVVALTLIMPAIWIRELKTRRRKCRRQICPTCGYDIRATPNRCPECGSAPNRAPSIST